MTFRHSAVFYDHNRIMSVSGDARGFIETRGHVGAIGSTDAMVKTAGGELLGQEYVEAGYVSVTVCGDIGTLQAATDAGGPYGGSGSRSRGTPSRILPSEWLASFLARGKVSVG